MAAAIVACGGSSRPKVLTKPEWTARYGAAVSAVGTQLDFARSALDKGQRDAILSACNLLHDDLGPAEQALPVPNLTVDAALRTSLNDLSTGVEDCLQGARVASVASITERAMAELARARTELDTANRDITNWS
jgi:hypothetical protein